MSHRHLLLLALALAFTAPIVYVVGRESTEAPPAPLAAAGETRASDVPSASTEARVEQLETEHAVGRTGCAHGGRHLVTGRTVDADGRPVAGAEIVLLRPGCVDVHTSSDLAGTFALDIEPGPTAALTLVARRDGWAPGVVDRTRAPDRDETDFGDVPLLAGGRIAGTVLDLDHSPNTTARVRVLPVGGPLRRLGGARTADLLADCIVQADGSFVCGGLPPGAYVVVATAPCRATCRSDRVAVSAGATAQLAALVLRAGHVLAGSVVDGAGAPVAFANVDLRGARGDLALQHATTDANGAFVFEHLEAGRYDVRVRSERAPQWLVRDVLVEQQQPLFVRLPAATCVAGTVLDAQGLPLPCFEVRLVPWLDDAAATARAERDEVAHLAAQARGDEAFAASMQRLAALGSQRRQQEQRRFPFGLGTPSRANGRDGAFAFERPAPGCYVLEIRAPGGVMHRTDPVQLPRAEGAAAIEVRLPLQ
ncbi:MAG TPA: carboxypeptidase-like regulatory domain-containing protein [Planctomycetota bacterium]|nr:carboxypeptidase-like regulatory domain-containing protein [Planctomycetota bacterium]